MERSEADAAQYHPDATFNPDPMPGWAETVQQAPWAPVGGGDYQKIFVCPWCGHTTIFDLPATITNYLVPIFGHRGSEELIVHVRCQCSEAHANRPDWAQGVGCGKGADMPGPPGAQ